MEEDNLTSNAASTVNHPFAWDPSNPSRLSFFQIDPATTSSTDFSLRQYHVSADTGVSCHKAELTALLNLLEAYEKYYMVVVDDGNDDTAENQSAILRMDHLQVDGGGFASSSSRLQRLSLAYRKVLGDCIAEWEEQMEEDEEQQEAESPTTPSDKNGNNPKPMDLELLQLVYSVVHLSDIYLLSEHAPGSVTADTVRYLRLHHCPPLLPRPLEDDVDLFEQPYPEAFSGYWSTLQKLVLWGYLDDAWKLLQHHSYYRALVATIQQGQQSSSLVTMLDPSVELASLKEIRDGFRLIQEILLFAPIPGGRQLNEEQFEIDEVPSTTMEYLDITTEDWKLWDPTGIDDDFTVFSCERALYKLRRWQEHVRRVRATCALVRKVPELDEMLGVLSGELISTVEFGSWAEQLCAELLYKTPHLRPTECSNRTLAIMKRFGTVQNAIVAIMQGEAGRAIQQMYELGGGSGAALPSTLMALIYSLFVESGVIPHETIEFRTTFLCRAAFDVVSSLAVSDPDIGVQIAVRLLMPFAKIGNSEIVGALAEVLEHYTPSTDHHARTVLRLCKPLVEKKSSLILYACTSVLLSLYRFHLSQFDWHLATMLLLDGIELESLVLPEPSPGACYRTLAAKCHFSSMELLQALVHDAEVGDQVLLAATAMMSALQMHAVDADKIPEAIQLVHITEMYTMMRNGDSPKKVGRHIVDLLEPVLDLNSDTLVAISPTTFVPDLMRLAEKLLEPEQVMMTPEMEMVTSTIFDKHGALVVSECFARLQAWNAGFPDSEEQRMNSCFTKALAHAYAADNSKKQNVFDSTASIDLKKEKVFAAQMHKYDTRLQQGIVAKMLSY